MARLSITATASFRWRCCMSPMGSAADGEAVRDAGVDIGGRDRLGEPQDQDAVCDERIACACALSEDERPTGGIDQQHVVGGARTSGPGQAKGRRVVVADDQLAGFDGRPITGAPEVASTNVPELPPR